MLAPAPFGRWILAQLRPTHVAMLDQGLVSGLGFLTSVLAARALGLAAFGKVAIALVLAGAAQGVGNALLVAPLMTLAGTPRGRSPAFQAAALAAGSGLGLGLGVLAALGFVLFSSAQGGLSGIGLPLAVAALAGTQFTSLVVRRVLFAAGRGDGALAMDCARAALLVAGAAAAWAFDRTIGPAGVLGLLAVANAVPALLAARLLRAGRRGLRCSRAVLRRCWPLGRWLLPSVAATFGQEQAIWLLVGVGLGDATVGGLRAAQYLVSFAYPFLASLDNTVPVEASRIAASAGRRALRAYLARTALAFSPLACGLPALAALFAPEALRLVYGAGFEPFAPALRIFAIVVLFVFVRDLLGYFFRAVGEARVIFRGFVLSLLATLLLALPLVRLAGANGAALAIALGHGLSMAYLLIAAARAR